jgi:hypothetical protein
MKYKGFEMYYKIPVNIEIQKAYVFSDKYTYYYKTESSDNMQLLGKFKYMGKVSCNSYHHDYDYDAYFFDTTHILTNKKSCIYCCVISDSEENMVPIEDTTYGTYPVYYKNESA